MGYDGSLKFETKIDNNGFKSGISNLTGLATKGAAAVSAALSAAGVAAIKVGMDFEAGMSQVAAVSGATGADLEALTAKAEEMGAKTKFSATEASEALNYMAMAGWKTEDMMGGIEGIMNLAAASGESLGTTSDIVTDALTAFGLAASDSGRFADVLAAASSNANTNVSMMGATFKYAAPIAGALGYSIEDTAVAIGLMANAGIKADQAGTSLRSIMTRLSAPPKAAAEAIDELGLSITNTDGTMKPFAEVMTELREKFAGMSEEQQVANAKALAGQEAMSGLLAIVNAAPEDFAKLTDAVANSSGAAEDMAKIMQDNLKGQITILGSTLEGLGIKIYNKFEGPLKEATKTAISGVNSIIESVTNGELSGSLDSLANSIGSFISGVASFTASVLPTVIKGFAAIVSHGTEIVAVLGTIKVGMLTMGASSAIPGLVKGWQAATTAARIYGTGMSSSLSLASAAAGVLTGNLTLVQAATGAATGATNAFSAAIAANPIGFAITALAALAGMLFVVHKQLKEAKEELEAGTKKILEQRDAWEELSEASKEQAEGDLVQINHTADLIQELDSLTDANGRVKAGDEERAKALYALINEAMPDAIKSYSEENGLVIELADNIGELIEEKKALAVAEAYKDDYAEAQKKKSEGEKELIELTAEHARLVEEKKQAERDMNDHAAGWAQTRIEEVEKQIADQHELNKSYGETIGTYEQMQSAIANKDWQGVQRAIAGFGLSLKDATNATKEELQAQYDEINSHVFDVEALYQDNKISQATYDAYWQANLAAKDALDQAIKQAEEAGIQEGEARADGIESTVPQAGEAAGKATDAATTEMESGVAKAGAAGGETANAYSGSLGDGAGGAAANAGAVGDAGINAFISKHPLFANAGTESGGMFAAALLDGQPATSANSTTLAIMAHTGANSKAGEMHGIGANYGAGFASGIASAVGKVKTAVSNMVTAAINKAREIGIVQSPSKVMRSIGVFYGTGFALGLTDTGSKVEAAAKALGLAAINSFKGKSTFRAAAESLSDSGIDLLKSKAKDYKDVGELYISHMEDGLTERNDQLITAMEKAYDEQYEALKGANEAAEKALSEQQDAAEKALSDKKDEASKAQLEQLKKANDAELDALKKANNKAEKEFSEGAKDQITAYKEALATGTSEAVLQLKNTIGKLSEAAQAKFDEITGNIESMRSKLAAGDLFTISDKSGEMNLANMDAQISAVERYNKALTALKDKGVSEDFLAEVTSMGTEEGAKFAELLLSQDNKAFEDYVGKWEEKQRLAKEVSQKFYQDQLNTLEKDFTGEIKGALAGVPDVVEDVGVKTIRGFIDGINGQMSNASKAMRRFAEEIKRQIREALEINSPSKWAKREIGANLAKGVSSGWESEMQNVYAKMRQAVDAESAKLSVQVAASAQNPANSGAVRTETIHHNSTIERIASIKFEGDMAALGRFLRPIITMEERRIGGNMIRGTT